MSLHYKLNQDDQDEVLKNYTLILDERRWPTSKKIEEGLQVWRKHRSKKGDWAVGLAGLFHQWQMLFFDVAMIERYKNNDLRKMRECLSVSARCGYLTSLVGWKVYSSGDCIHLHDILNALVSGDALAVERFGQTFGGPSKIGHKTAVVHCNGWYAALYDGFCAKNDSIKQLRERKDTRYYRCLFDGLIAIVDGSEENLRMAITVLVCLQKRQSHLFGLQKVICAQAHALYRAWQMKGGRSFADEMNLYLWDSDLESFLAGGAGTLELDLRDFNPVVAKWIKSLPASIDRQELLESL